MRKVLVLVCVVALLGSATALVGCGSSGSTSSSQTPEGVTRAFWTAMLKQDTNTVWNLVSEESQKAGGSKSELAAGLKQFASKTTSGVKITYGLTTINGNKATVGLTVSSGGNRVITSMPLIKENGVWKVDLVKFKNQNQ